MEIRFTSDQARARWERAHARELESIDAKEIDVERDVPPELLETRVDVVWHGFDAW